MFKEVHHNVAFVTGHPPFWSRGGIQHQNPTFTLHTLSNAKRVERVLTGWMGTFIASHTWEKQKRRGQTAIKAKTKSQIYGENGAMQMCVFMWLWPQSFSIWFTKDVDSGGPANSCPWISVGGPADCSPWISVGGPADFCSWIPPGFQPGPQRGSVAGLQAISPRASALLPGSPLEGLLFSCSQAPGLFHPGFFLFWLFVLFVISIFPNEFVNFLTVINLSF